MAATRGDPRRRAGPVFTVQSSNCGPGPCRDGLHSEYSNRYPRNTSDLPRGFRSNLDRNAYLNANSTEYDRKDRTQNFVIKDSAKDVLAEVRVQDPMSEKSRSANEAQLGSADQVFIIIIHTIYLFL